MDGTPDDGEETTATERRIRLDVYHHVVGPIDLHVSFTDVIDIDVDVSGNLTVTAATPTPVPTSIHLVPGLPVTIR